MVKLLYMEKETADYFWHLVQKGKPFAEPYGRSLHRVSLQLGKSYTFGSKTYQDKADVLPDLYQALLKIVDGFEFNGIHINYYDNSLLTTTTHNSMLGWHTDDEPEIDTNMPILSVSLGGDAVFDYRINDKVDSVILKHGTIAAFKPTLEHRVRRLDYTTQRVSITYRKHW